MKYVCIEKVAREVDIPEGLEEKILEIWNNKEPENHKYFDIIVYLLAHDINILTSIDTKFVEHKLLLEE
jgi:hypothetical protein